MHAALGIAATFPMIALSQTVENSNRRDAHYVNFATTNMVVSLFGRREEAANKVKTAQVLGLSFGLVALTAIVEEVVFRGFLSTALYSLSNHNMVFAWLGQATLFGLGHVHPKSRPEENRLVAGLQLTNAAWHGLMVMLTGSLVPGIISHLLYDWHVLASTWHQVNLQMDWTEEHALNDKQLTDRTELSEATRSFLTRFFYAFDKEHTGSLSEPDVQRAVAYAFMLETPPDQDIVHEAIQGQERVELDDFVQVLLDLRAKQQRVA
jgi:membrane protease YdiL (CAAX protease family)